MAVGGALFGSGRSGGGHAAGAGRSSLLEFRAGKMNLGADNLVTADKRKGMIILDQSDDQLMHFKWKDRTTGTIEDDLIIFPDDIEFKKVSQCTTGRVFLLKFKNSSRKMFFWMQEPKSDKDDEYCKKVNDYLNNPPAPGSASRGGGGSGGGSGSGLDLSSLGDSELQSLLGSMSQQQLMQIFGGGSGGSGGLGGLTSLLGGNQGPGSGSRQRSSGARRANRDTTSSATTTASTTTTAPASTATTTASSASSGSGATTTSSASQPPIQLSDLQNILSGIQMPEGAKAEGVSVDLASGGITAETVQPLLRNPDFVKRMKELLPAEHQAGNIENEIKGTVQSPQFQQALSLFSSAFQTGQLAPLIREFNLGDEAIAAASAGNLEAFVKALQDKQAKKKDEPEDMALD